MDAYDAIYRIAGDSYFKEITSRDSFKAYAKHRLADQKAGRSTWRWSTATSPADEAAIAEVEHSLVIAYPEDYTNFLKDKGECRLFVRLPHEDAVLKFANPSQQVRMRDDFMNFVRNPGVAGPDQIVVDGFGLSLDHLIPIAEPQYVSNLLLLYVGPGERYGHCYVWNHDDPWELVCEQPSFAAMKEKLLGGIVLKDPQALDLFNIHLFEEEDLESDED
ncbi:SMI1/KNR4 family protein [Aliirhizobium terrae]|uniref:SMI1/KNR4 family protein n=1 Tax=Terrirhizobium terrae TaxID=2926709 RepID=UPI002576CDE9|nr:SMI1/KNR4 family protein [Rhizobium sp. CC-CFT758]WJH39282.1 SMI1/KNR4 family protein [Rhizobium sp. CC-CFT758]